MVTPALTRSAWRPKYTQFAYSSNQFSNYFRVKQDPPQKGGLQHDQIVAKLPKRLLEHSKLRRVKQLGQHLPSLLPAAARFSSASLGKARRQSKTRLAVCLLAILCSGFLAGCGSSSYAGLTEKQAADDAVTIAHKNGGYSYAYVFKTEKTRNPFGDKAWRAFVNANDQPSSACLQVYVWSDGTTDHTYSQACP
jgi:hypothetical protein